MKSFKVLVLLSVLLGIITVYVANIAAADGEPVEYTFDPMNGNGDQGGDIDLNVNHDEGGGDDLTSEKSNPRRDSGTSSPGNFTGGGAGSGRVTPISYTTAPGSNVIVDAGTLVESQAQIDTLRAAFAELQGVNRNQKATIEKLTQENKSLVGRLEAQTEVNNTILAEVGNIEAENNQLRADKIAMQQLHGEALKTAANRALRDVKSAQRQLEDMQEKNDQLAQTSKKTVAELTQVKASIEPLKLKKDLTAQEKAELARLQGVDAKLQEEQAQTAQLQEQLSAQEAASKAAIEALRKNHGVQVAELEQRSTEYKSKIAALEAKVVELEVNLSDKTGTSLGEETKAPDAQQKAEMTERLAALEADLAKRDQALKDLQAQLAEAQRASVKPALVADHAQPQVVKFQGKSLQDLMKLFGSYGVFGDALTGFEGKISFEENQVTIEPNPTNQLSVDFTKQINSYAVRLLEKCTVILTVKPEKLSQPEVIDAAQNVIKLIESFEKNGYSMTEETKQRIAILKALPSAAELELIRKFNT